MLEALVSAAGWRPDVFKLLEDAHAGAAAACVTLALQAEALPARLQRALQLQTAALPALQWCCSLDLTAVVMTAHANPSARLQLWQVQAAALLAMQTARGCQANNPDLGRDLQAAAMQLIEQVDIVMQRALTQDVMQQAAGTCTCGVPSGVTSEEHDSSQWLEQQLAGILAMLTDSLQPGGQREAGPSNTAVRRRLLRFMAKLAHRLPDATGQVQIWRVLLLRLRSMSDIRLSGGQLQPETDQLVHALTQAVAEICEAHAAELDADKVTQGASLQHIADSGSALAALCSLLVHSPCSDPSSVLQLAAHRQRAPWCTELRQQAQLLSKAMELMLIWLRTTGLKEHMLPVFTEMAGLPAGSRHPAQQPTSGSDTSAYAAMLSAVNAVAFWMSRALAAFAAQQPDDAGHDYGGAEMLELVASGSHEPLEQLLQDWMPDRVEPTCPKVADLTQPLDPRNQPYPARLAALDALGLFGALPGRLMLHCRHPGRQLPAWLVGCRLASCMRWCRSVKRSGSDKPPPNDICYCRQLPSMLADEQGCAGTQLCAQRSLEGRCPRARSS